MGSLEEILMGIFIPIIATVGFAVYTIRVLILKDMKPLESGGLRKYKDKEKYRETAGKLLLMMTIVSAAATGLTFVSEAASFAVIVVGMAVFAFLWKKMNDQYGA